MNAKEGVNIKTLSPSTIVGAINIIVPQGLVSIEGVVTQLNPYPKIDPKVIYGDLRDLLGDAYISFKCPIDHAPMAMGEQATIRGYISINHNKQFSLRINGDCVDHRKPTIQSSHPLLIKNERAKLKLLQLFEKENPRSLAIIGTPIAVGDVLTACATTDINRSEFKTYDCNFNSTEELFKTAEKALREGAKGIAFTRGGNDATLKHWDDSEFISRLAELKCPIYTAIGHSNQAFLVEKYVSDESFATPSSLGIAISHSIQSIFDTKKLIRKLSNQNELISQSKNEI